MLSAVQHTLGTCSGLPVRSSRSYRFETLLLLKFVAQMLVPSKAKPNGLLPTVKVPRGAPSLARSFVTVISDGNPGLAAALERVWPGVPRQRCTVHKLRNLEAKAPQHAHAELREDYHRIVYAQDRAAATRAHQAFLGKWRKRSPAVATSLEEAGEELLTFYAFPPSQWLSLRTTNAIERLQLEFRRRVKTQGALPGETAALRLLFGLLASGQIRLRRIKGFREINEKHEAAA